MIILISSVREIPLCRWCFTFAGGRELQLSAAAVFYCPLLSLSALLFNHKVVDGRAEQYAQRVEVIDVRQRPSRLPVIHGLRTREVQVPLYIQNRLLSLDPAAEDVLPRRLHIDHRIGRHALMPSSAHVRSTK